eukprot:jgi/Chrzof1/6248/Cz17g17110.t1
MTLIVFSASMLLLFVAGCHAQLTSSTCQAVPKVPGVNQEPSDPTKYGKCTGALDSHVVSTGSNWCAFNGMGYWPAGPAPKAKQCLKFGRMTVYRGPIYGSQPDHKGACNATLVGSNESSVVAVSTKYLKTAQGGWVADKGACGQCMCIHVRGVDDKYNPGVKYQSAKAHFGLTFLAKVGDRCGECEDDHIDILMDRPVSYAPWSPSSPGENNHAQYVNALPGLRGFGDPWIMRGGDFSPEAVGTWVSDWQFVPCNWNHNKCAALMKDMGYSQVYTPQPTVGVESSSMRVVNKPTVALPWSTPSTATATATNSPASGKPAGSSISTKPTPAATATQAAAAGPKTKKATKPHPMPAVAAYAMCGGMGAGCDAVASANQCQDVQWAVCPPGHGCSRNDKWWWMCVPGAVAQS